MSDDKLATFAARLQAEQRHLDADEREALSEALRNSVSKSETVTIPRAQYDALMKAAAWVLNNCAADCPLVAALRAAGIQTESIHD